MGRLGLRSAMYAGEGEPLLHRDIARIIQTTKESGISAAITTNGTPLKRALAEKLLPHTEWIKISINAGSAKTYAAIHGTKEADFDRVLQNLETAVEVRAAQGSQCTLGAQIVALPENHEELLPLARRVRDIGLDYLVVKPYSQHTQSLTVRYQNLRYREGIQALHERLKELETDQFQVIVRVNAMARSAEKEKPYKSCEALPFWSYIDAGGNVWGCSVLMAKSTGGTNNRVTNRSAHLSSIAGPTSTNG
jgi:molybdenum cofactor biosynthesis enzyme MoaA